MMRATPGAGEDRDLRRDFLGQALMRAATLARIFALGILAHDDPIKVFCRNIPQRPGDAGQDARRAHIGVLIEALADGEPQAPERDVVGHVRRADRAEIDGIEGAKLIDPTCRHQHAMTLVMVGAPVELLDVETKPPIALGANL